MKKFFNCTMYIGLLTIALSFTSCQDEFEEINTNEQETITASSTTANLVKSASAKDGSVDNVVDRSSCFAINFPYTVKVNGLEITVDSLADIRFLNELVKQYDDNFEELLEIVFPITITYPDYSELTINNSADFRELANQCVGEPDDSRIRCISFVYPINIFTFDLDNEQRGSFIIESDRQLRRLFDDLDDDDTLVSLEFPISLKKSDGSEIRISSNAELSAAIESAKGLCSNDDDDDDFDDDFYDDDDGECENCSQDQLTQTLLSCPFWYVNELELNDQDDLENLYVGYWFSFDADGAVEVIHNDEIFTGSWATSTTLNTIALVINIPELSNFNAAWRLYEIENEDGGKKIELEFGDENEMELKSNCKENLPLVCQTEAIINALGSCKWDITNLDGTFFEELTIDFSNNNIHVFGDDDDDSEEDVLDEGNWQISGTTITFNALSMTLANYVGDWTFVSCEPGRFKLQRGEEIIVLTKDCD